MLTVYYDARCGLCRPEIHHYRKLSAPDRVEYVDVNTLLDLDASQLPQGLDPLAALHTLHVRDDAGTWHQGLEGFRALWSELPRYGWLARLSGWPVINPSLRGAYKVFAAWRFKRSPHCQLAVQDHAGRLHTAAAEFQPAPEGGATAIHPEP